MKKSRIIILIVICLLVIAAGAMYYFYFYQGRETVVPGETETQAVDDEGISAGDMTVKDLDESEDKVEQVEVVGNELDEGTGDEVEVENISEGEVEKLDREEESGSAEEVFDDIAELNYSYKNVFRNPFRDYRVRVDEVSREKVLTLAQIKAGVPFEIKGIIGNNYERIAVLNYRGSTRLIREQTDIEGYRIIDIQDNGLLLLYRGIQFKLEMESDIGEG